MQEEGGPSFPAGCARYAFVNSGAYMGPPAALLSMLRWTLAYACLDLVPNLWEWSWAQLQGVVRLDLFESLPSRRFGCRASTTNSTTKSRSTVYIALQRRRFVMRRM